MNDPVRRFVFPSKRGYRRRILWLILGVGALLSGLLCWHLWRMETGIMRTTFREEARDHLHTLVLGFQSDLEVVESLRSFFECSEHVTLAEFSHFTSMLLKRHPSILALEWAPLVRDEEREAFVAAARAEFPQYALRDKNDHEVLVPSPQSPYYYPVLYVEPQTQPNLGVLGLNVLSGPRRRENLERSSTKGSLVVSQPLQLLQTPGTERDGILSSVPLLGNGTDTLPRGFIIGVFLLRDIVKSALAGSSPSIKTDILIFDETEGKPSEIFRLGQSAIKSETVFATSLKELIGDRTWRFEARALASAYAHLRTPNPWVALLSGLSMTGLLAYLYVVLGTRSHFAEEQVDLKTRELQELNQRLDAMARTDGLTGLLNRRALNEGLDSEIDRARRSGKPLSVMMADLDHFKLVNDRFGHAAGDQVLKGFARIMKGRLRSTDVVGRYGGEEFCILLPETAAQEAMKIAEVLRRDLESTPIDIGGGNAPLKVTCSLGVAETSGQPARGRELLLMADKALYAAKDGGRNRVMLATAPGVAAV